MIWIYLFIPFIISVLFLFFYKKKLNNNLKESFLITLLCAVIVDIVIFAVYGIMIYNNTDDIEYLSYHYTKIRHEDSWNERVTVKKTRTIYINGHSRIQTYTTKETRNHPDKWIGYLNDNSIININKKTYNELKDLWKTDEIFIDLHRDYYTKDGDAQEYVWDNNINTIKPYVTKHHYQNKVIGSSSAFKFNEINKEDAKALGLYDYPSVKNNDIQPIIGCNKLISNNIITKLKTFNSLYGYDKQISVFLLLYPNTSVSIAEDQRSYWQGGNKNEFVICIGVDTLTNKVQWSECFSWMDDVTMEVECRNFINKQDKIDIIQICDWLENNLHLWKRKEFNDFDYINVSLSDNQEIALLMIAIILILIINCFLFSYFNNKS